MIIECCGAPGAGKTTIAADLVPVLRAHDMPAVLPLEGMSARRSPRVRLLRKLWRAGTELLRHPISSTRILGQVAQTRQRTARDVIARSLNMLVLRSAFRKARASGGIHVFDQGIIQELASIAYGAHVDPDVELADPGAEGLAPDLILAIHTDAETANTRLALRPGRQSRVEAAGADQHSEIVRQADLIHRFLTEWLDMYAHQLQTTVHRVDNSGAQPPVDDLVRAVQDRLSQERTNARSAGWQPVFSNSSITDPLRRAFRWN